MKTPKTSGLEWLYHSMASFNGTGYADRTNGKTFLQSYRLYKRLKNKTEAFELTNIYASEALEFAEHLSQGKEPSHQPSGKFYKRYLAKLQTNENQLEIL